MVDKLTPQQELVVRNRGGNLLVSAAAGSGKTKVLVDRLLSYILDPVVPANIDDFLIITYTKAAASELREKIANKLSELVSENPENRHLQQQLQRIYLAKISTVHAFCTDILRENAYRMDIPADFRVAEETECTVLRERVLNKLLEQAYGDMQTDEDLQAFFETQGFGRDDRKVTEIIQQVYSSAMCHLSPDDWLSQCLDSYCMDVITDAGETIWGKYLILDLHQCVEMHLTALGNCIDAAELSGNMEKPIALLQDTCNQLKVLLSCHTWEEITKKRELQFGTLTFSKNADLELREKIKAVRNACKEELGKKLVAFSEDNSVILADFTQNSAAVRGIIALVRKFKEEFAKAKRARRILDFSDLEHLALDLLRGKSRSGITAAATEIGSRFTEVMVDEYQDTNAVQDGIFAALTGKRQNCFMVGDVKQSIYQFRLADPTIFLQKYNTYAPAENALAGEGRKVLLSANFRSCEGVIEGVNSVFSRCMSETVGGLVYGMEEQLNAGKAYLPIHEPAVSLYGIHVASDTYAEEAAVVAKEIRNMLESGQQVRDKDTLRPVRPEDIVILLRSPNSVGAEFAYALQNEGIRYQFGGDKDILQAESVQVLRGILQVIDNPLQDIPLTAVLMSRVFCYTADDMAKLRSNGRTKAIYENLVQAEDSRTKAFLQTLRSLRQTARHKGLCALLKTVLSTTGLDSIYGAISQFEGESVQAFLQLASGAEKMGRQDLRSFLLFLETLDGKGVTSGTENCISGAVSILSIHKSKGLEFPVVFLSGLSKAFNREDLKEHVLCDKSLYLGLTCVDTKNRVRYPSVAKRAIAAKKVKDSLSEELRVLYVAMTRAKDRLIMTYASKYLENTLRKLSLRMNMSTDEMLASNAGSMGDWVLQSAMHRIEAGALFAVGGRPNALNVSETPWKIAVLDGNLETATGREEISDTASTLSPDLVSQMEDALHFIYPYMAATTAPSKQTATQLKGRVKDTEAAELTKSARQHYTFRKPSFVQETGDALFRGTAMHTALQHMIMMPNCTQEEVEKELKTLVKKGKLTDEQLALIDRNALVRFFSTPLWKRIYASKEVLREFKFSILGAGELFGDGLEGEQVLLQGVVDCAIIEDNGITVIDFKTDRVTEETIGAVASGYAPQIKAYGNALSRIFEKPVKKLLLYFLSASKEFPVQ